MNENSPVVFTGIDSAASYSDRVADMLGVRNPEFTITRNAMGYMAIVGSLLIRERHLTQLEERAGTCHS